MTTSDENSVEKLFHEAVQLPLEERSQFLDQQCPDAAIRAEVDVLLKFDAANHGPLSGSLYEGISPTIIGDLSIVRRGDRRPSGSSNWRDSIDHGRFVPGTLLDKRYRIIGMLGKGGMGEVYRADDLEIGQSVALKFLPEEVAADQTALARFRSEVRLARKVSHSNVCRVYDIGQIDGQTFLSMEYVDGEDLAQLLKRIGRFPQERANELARQLCMGLHAAHEEDVLHRDLKPANVMVDGRGKLLITDFGLAAVAGTIRPEDILSGTVAYMSPEQLAMQDVSERSDIYALGMILYEIYTGKSAWGKFGSIEDAIKQRNSGSATSPSSHVSDLDPRIDPVIECCLDPDPEKRPESALQVMAALPGGDPIRAAQMAGETPSPEMVAAAGDRTKVNSRASWIALAFVILGLFFTAFLDEKTSSVANSSLTSDPAVLRREVREMLEGFGYKAPPLEQIDGFRSFSGVADKPMAYWYRQMPPGSRGFRVNGFWSGTWGNLSWSRPDFFQPVFKVPGELSVVMSDGKNPTLQYFRAKPALRIQGGKPTAVEEPPWKEWLPPALIGYQLGEHSGESAEDADEGTAGTGRVFPPLQVDPDWSWSPPDAFDAMCVWRGEENDRVILVEAAAWNGRLTYFRKVMFPEGTVDHTTRLATLSEDAGRGNQNWYVFTLIMFSVFVGVVLAWRNWRSGKGDRAGGLRLALYVGVVNLLLLALRCRLTFNPIEIYTAVIALGMSQVLLEVARTWVWYMALEPIVRHVWPQILISSSRLLEGRYRDPVVGRDLLAGAFFAVVSTILYKSNVWIHGLLGFEINAPRIFSPVPMKSTKELLGTAVAAHGYAFFIAVFAVMTLLMSCLVTRSKRAAVLLALLLYVLVVAFVIGGEPAITICFAVTLGGIVLFVVVRFGVLALIAYYTCRCLLSFLPLTLNSNSWYFGNGLTAAAFVVLIAGVGCYFVVHREKPAGQYG